MNIWSKNTEDTKYFFVKGSYVENISEIKKSIDKYIFLDIHEDIMTSLDLIDIVRSNYNNVIFCLPYSIESTDVLCQLSKTKEFMTAIKLTHPDIFSANIILESEIDYIYLENLEKEFISKIKKLRDEGFYKTRIICNLIDKSNISEYISITDVAILNSIS